MKKMTMKKANSKITTLLKMRKPKNKRRKNLRTRKEESLNSLNKSRD